MIKRKHDDDIENNEPPLKKLKLVRDGNLWLKRPMDPTVVQPEWSKTTSVSSSSSTVSSSPAVVEPYTSPMADVQPRQLPLTLPSTSGMMPTMVSTLQHKTSPTQPMMSMLTSVVQPEWSKTTSVSSSSTVSSSPAVVEPYVSTTTDMPLQQLPPTYPPTYNTVPTMVSTMHPQQEGTMPQNSFLQTWREPLMTKTLQDLLMEPFTSDW